MLAKCIDKRDDELSCKDQAANYGCFVNCD